jgi:hypothetical protein
MTFVSGVVHITRFGVSIPPVGHALLPLLLDEDDDELELVVACPPAPLEVLVVLPVGEPPPVPADLLPPPHATSAVPTSTMDERRMRMA